MEDKMYVLSDGRVKRVPAGEEEAFQAELKEKGLTATIKSDMSGNLISSPEDATAEQNLTASTQETDQSQINQQTGTESKSEVGSLESQITEGKNKLDSLDNVIGNFNHEAKLEQIEKEIEKINNTDYTSNEEVEEANKKIEDLGELYQNMYIDYKDVYNEYETSRNDYNKLIGQQKKGKKEKQDAKKPKINLLKTGIDFLTGGPQKAIGDIAAPYMKNKALRTGEGAISMVNNWIKGYETGELPFVDAIIDQATPGKLPIYKIAKEGSKILREKGVDVPENIGPISLETQKERREKYESFMLDAKEKGIPLEIAQKLDPTNRIKFEGALEWFDDHTYRHTDKNGDPLDYLELFSKGKVLKGTDAFLDDVFGAIPSLLVSRLPGGVGAAFMGAGMYMDNFERELYKRGIDDETTRNQIVKDSIISGTADFASELIGGRILNKIIRSGIPKEKAKDLLTQLPKVIAKKILPAGFIEFATEGAAGWLDLQSDEWSYGDEITLKQKFRAFIKDGFIGMFLGAGATVTATPTKKDVYKYVANEKYKQDQLGIEKNIINLTRDADQATGKSKDILNKKIKNLKDRKEQNEKNNFDFFENLTTKEKEIYANNLDVQSEQLDILYDQRHSKETREEASKKYKEAIEANNNFYDGSSINYDAKAEEFIGKTLKATEAIKKQKKSFGFNKENLDVEFVDSDTKLEELTKKFPGFKESDGMFFAEDKGKNKIYINSKVAFSKN